MDITMNNIINSIIIAISLWYKKNNKYDAGKALMSDS